MLHAIYVLFVLRTYYILNILYYLANISQCYVYMCMLDAISMVNCVWYVPSKCTSPEDIGHRFRFVDVRIHKKNRKVVDLS